MLDNSYQNNDKIFTRINLELNKLVDMHDE